VRGKFDPTPPLDAAVFFFAWSYFVGAINPDFRILAERFGISEREA
jgi:hypothetical protein